MNNTKRYTIDFGEKFDTLLSELALTKETTKSEIIRRAVAYYAFLEKEREAGNKVSITDGQFHVLKEVILP